MTFDDLAKLPYGTKVGKWIILATRRGGTEVIYCDAFEFGGTEIRPKVGSATSLFPQTQTKEKK